MQPNIKLCKCKKQQLVGSQKVCEKCKYGKELDVIEKIRLNEEYHKRSNWR
jgi:hypothetical protein